MLALTLHHTPLFTVRFSCMYVHDLDPSSEIEIVGRLLPISPSLTLPCHFEGTTLSSPLWQASHNGIPLLRVRVRYLTLANDSVRRSFVAPVSRVLIQVALLRGRTQKFLDKVRAQLCVLLIKIAWCSSAARSSCGRILCRSPFWRATRTGETHTCGKSKSTAHEREPSFYGQGLFLFY
jgi:hypothetical protein